MKISQPESPEPRGERSSSETRGTDIVEQDERTQQYTQTQRNHQHKAHNTELCIRERTQYGNTHGTLDFYPTCYTLLFLQNTTPTLLDCHCCV